MPGKLMPPRKVYLVVCADGYSCVKPGYVHSRWEHRGKNPYDHRTEARFVAGELDSFLVDKGRGRTYPPAACGPHRVVAYAPVVSGLRGRPFCRNRSRRKTT
jgi:hypothetical protein